jgi:capsular exopolysaccharide synthesis family protein
MSIDAPPTEHTPQADRDTQFRFVLNTLAEHWVMLCIGTVIGILAFGSWNFFNIESYSDQYQTSTDLLVSPNDNQRYLIGNAQEEDFLSMKASTLVDRTDMGVLEEKVARALSQMNLTGASNVRADDIAGKIQLIADDDKEKITVRTVRCSSDEQAENIAEFAARIFVEQNQDMGIKEGRVRHAFILKKVEELRQQLTVAETEEWEYNRKIGFITPGSGTQEMAQMTKELATLRATRDEGAQQLEALAAKLQLNKKQFPNALNQVTENVLDTLFVELNAMLREKLTLSTIWEDNYGPLQDLTLDIEEKKLAIIEADRLIGSGGAGGSDMWAERQAIYKAQLRLQLDQTSTAIRIISLEKQLSDMTPQIPKLATQSLEHERLAQTTQRIREEFNDALRQEWNVRRALREGPGKIERNNPVATASLMPPRSSGNNLWVYSMIGGILGFVSAFGLAMLQEANDTSIRSIEDVNLYIGKEVIGTIPRMRFGRPRGSRRQRATFVTTVDEEQIDACIVTQHDPKSPISEAYRTLRTNFQFATLNARPRTVMVTSAVPGEGKTTTATNLAVTMADRGIRVLIVDTDLRRPNVHRVLRMERGPGLADVLREGLEPKSVIRPTRIENLWIVSSGRVPPNPSELIGSDRMADLMRQLGAEFDLVICDAPSVLVVTDPVLLATHVDTCVMVVSTKNVRRETVIRANKLLESANIDISGVVVNGLETTRRHYYYYYYYYDDGTPIRHKWYHFG